jgi:O-methyltransferase
MPAHQSVTGANGQATSGRADEDFVARISALVQPLTMVPETGVQFTVDQAIGVIKRNVPGVMVECGVWRGGNSIAMLLAQRELLGKVQRPVYMFDSFEGLPPADSADGPLASQWQQGSTAVQSFDNCTASVAELQASLDRLNFEAADYRVVPGWFHDTVPLRAAELASSKIALLRLDGDWYTSTKTCLDHLMPAVSENGVVILDDYYAWDGCARAVHDYLSQQNLPYRIRSLPGFVGAYFVKKSYRDEPNAVDDGVDPGSALVCSLAQREYYIDLEKTKNWLEEQRENWRRIAKSNEQTLLELTAHTHELEQAKLWLDEQRVNWQGLAEERERSLNEQVRYVHDLEEAKAWLQEQLAHAVQRGGVGPGTS